MPANSVDYAADETKAAVNSAAEAATKAAVIATTAGAKVRVYTSMTKLVISRLFIPIAQHLIGLAGFLEFSLGLLVVWV